MLEQVKNWMGFGDEPAKWWMWVGVSIVIVVVVVMFFLSFSLARHKRMVAELRASLLESQTRLENQKRLTQIAVLEERQKHLQAQRGRSEEENKKLQSKVQKIKQDIEQGKKELQKKEQGLKGKSLGDLLKQSDQLLKETF